MILWGMGISQHVHGTDNARCLIALTLMTGQVGRPGTGLHPLRGQNNVQGASRLGPDPDDVPGLPARATTPEAHAALRESSGAPTLDPKPGLTVVEIMDAGLRRQDPRHVHHGREPGDVGSGRRARARGDGGARAPGGAGHLPDGDRLSRRRGAAGHRVAGEDRHGHQHRPHGAARPPGAGAAGRGARGPLDHRRAGEAAGPRLELRSIRRTCSTRCAAAWTRSRASPGSASSATRRSPIRARTRAIRASRWCSPTHFPTPTGRAKFVPAD